MQKNTQKKMVVLKTANSRSFEEVHLILRDNMDYREGAMVEEANRIIANAEQHKIYRKPKEPPSAIHIRLFWFFTGIVTTMSIVSLTVLLCTRLF